VDASQLVQSCADLCELLIAAKAATALKAAIDDTSFVEMPHRLG